MTRGGRVVAAALLGTACNRYALFEVVDGHGRSGDVDLLFVMDASGSMVEETAALAENFAVFVEAIAARQARGREGLPDAVTGYLQDMRDPGAFVDVQLALTTVDAEASGGALQGGVLRADTGDPTALADAFTQTLVCETACFPDRGALPSDPSYVCGADAPFLSQEVLDCTCGDDAWIGHCGGGREEALEAVYDAMCRAVDAPPEDCFDGTGPLLPADQGTNVGLLRPGATFLPVVVTDEGDDSRRVAVAEPNPASYLALFDHFDVPMSWIVIGPALDEDLELVCPDPTARPWGVLRYAYLVDHTGGASIDVHGDDCGPRDWAEALLELGDVVGGSVRKFPLRSPAVVTSIVVELGGEPVPMSEELGSDVFGVPIHGDGWSYDPDAVAVLLHGSAVPRAGAAVRIWYLPAR